MIATFRLGLTALGSRSGRVVALFAVLAALLLTCLLCLASALPLALKAPATRENARYPVGAGSPVITVIAGAPARINQRNTVWHGRHVIVIEVQSRRGITPPPGVVELPPAGTSLVSPALADLLRSNPTAMSVEIPHPVGRIRHAGLAEPSELIAYVSVATTRDDDTFTTVSGWGLRGSTLFRSDVSPYVALPLAALVLIPVIGLLSALLRLDSARRSARTLSLQVLGASRRQLLAADLGALALPILLGWLAGWLLEPVWDAAVDHVLFRDKVFFSTDLHAATVTHLLLGPALLILATVATILDLEANRATGGLSRNRLLRIKRRSMTAIGCLAAAVMLESLVLSSSPGSALRSYGPLLVVAGMALASAIIALPPLLVGAVQMWGRNSLASGIATGRLRRSEASWRSATLALVLVGAVAGTALSVLMVLDASDKTDQLLWNPQGMPAETAFVSASTNDLIGMARDGRYRNVLPAVPAGNVWITDGAGRKVSVAARLVPCQELAQFIDVRVATQNSCASAWVIDDALNPHSATAVVTTARGTVVQSSLRTAGYRAPAAMFGGTETVLLPVDSTTLDAAMRRLPGVAVNAIVELRGYADVERLRAALWHRDAPELNGSAGPLSVVLAKSDLVQDGHRYRDDYSALVIGLLALAGLVAGATVTVANTVDASEAQPRNTVLTALGAPAATVSSVRRLETLLPPLTAITLGWLLGAFVGIGYLHLSDYRELSGPAAGFPFRPYLVFLLVELGAVLVLGLLVELSAARVFSPPQATISLPAQADWSTQAG